MMKERDEGKKRLRDSTEYERQEEGEQEIKRKVGAGSGTEEQLKRR